MEITLLSEKFLACPPSLLAAAGLCLARRMLKHNDWHKNLVYYSGYTIAQLQPCVDLMISLLRSPVKYEAVFKKYSSKKFMKASLFVQEYAIQNFGLKEKK